MATINNNNLIKAVRALTNLAKLVSENPEYFSDWFDYDVMETCKEVIKLLKPEECKQTKTETK